MTGDMAVEREATQLIDHTSLPLASHIDVVIATPGRLAEHLSRGSFVSLHFLRSLSLTHAHTCRLTVSLSLSHGG